MSRVHEMVSTGMSAKETWEGKRHKSDAKSAKVNIMNPMHFATLLGVGFSGARLMVTLDEASKLGCLKFGLLGPESMLAKRAKQVRAV